MVTEYINKGVCSRKTVVELDQDHLIKSIEIVGGCSGNLKGITSLLTGMKAEEAIKKIKGIQCGARSTSCPDQVADALILAIEQLEKTNS